MLGLAGALAGLALAGCGGSDAPQTPSACLAPASEYVEALAAAPGDVRLADGTAISDCLVDEQSTGALQTVGRSLVGAATELNREALRTSEPHSYAELGYLEGAVERGASGTAGIHHDLVLRVGSAAAYAGASGDPLPARLERAFDRGRDAGLARG